MRQHCALLAGFETKLHTFQADSKLWGCTRRAPIIQTKLAYDWKSCSNIIKDPLKFLSSEECCGLAHLGTWHVEKENGHKRSRDFSRIDVWWEVACSLCSKFGVQRVSRDKRSPSVQPASKDSYTRLGLDTFDPASVSCSKELILGAEQAGDRGHSRVTVKSRHGEGTSSM